MSDVEDVGRGALAFTTLGTSELAREAFYVPNKLQKKAATQQKRASAAERKIQNIKTQRERRSAIREARRVRAEVQTGAQASGTSATSSATTGVAAIGTQLGNNLSFLDETTNLTNQISLFNDRAANNLRRASTRESIRNTGIQAASLL